MCTSYFNLTEDWSLNLNSFHVIWYTYIHQKCSFIKWDFKQEASRLLDGKMGSRMHMYYLFGNHIYCFSSISSYVLLVLCKAKRPLWWPHLNVWELKFSDEVFRFRYTPQFQMKCTLRCKFSDEVFRFRYTPHFQMKCSSQKKCTLRPKPEMRKWVNFLRWSVQKSCQIYPLKFRWSAQMKCTLRPKSEMRKWVHIFRWSVQIRCQIYPP